MASETPPSDNPEQSPERRWQLVQTLSKGDEVLINEREHRLTVCEITRESESGAMTQATLVGNGTEYTITTTEETTTPMITWPSATHTRPIQKIQAADTTILSTTRASDLLPSIQSHSDSVDIDRRGQSSVEVDITRIIGSCPVCDSVVVTDRFRAVCRACEMWCWIEQWEKF